MSIYRHEGSADCMVSRGLFCASGDIISQLVRALIFRQQMLYQIPTEELGTGKKPVVLFNGQLQEQQGVEGSAVIWDGQFLRTIDKSTEGLLI